MKRLRAEKSMIRLITPGRASFRLAKHDPTRPLVIDPVLVYSTFVGGVSSEYCTGLQDFMLKIVKPASMVIIFEKQIVRRTNRLIRVRKLMCLLSIFCVWAFPTVCCSASTCRS